MRNFGAFAEFFRRLAAGDSVAIGILIGFVVLAALAGLVVLAVRWHMLREEEEWARKRGRRPKR